jgi:hypothetical protein
MKKLFTLFAFLAVFLGANAVTIVDAQVDYTTMPDGSDVPLYNWGGTKEYLSIADGCLHFHNEAETDDPWGAQFFLIGGVDVEVGVTYTIEFKIKGSVEGPFWNIGFAGVPKYNIFTVPTEWTVLKFDYVAEKTEGDANFQCGKYVGDWDIEYIKIYHEGKEEKPVQWNNLLTNGDAEGENGDVACAYAKEFVAGAESQPAPYPAAIEADPDDASNKVFAVHAKAVDPPILWEEEGDQWGVHHNAGDPKDDNTWQNQFWITLPEGLTEGTQLKLSFKVKASEAVSKIGLQTHRWPGDYLGGFATLNTIDVTTEWTSYEKTFAVPAKHDDTGELFQSIAFNLSALADNAYTKDIDFYFDDLELSEMVLEHGFFVASANTETGLTYDFDNATKFVEGEDPDGGECLVATVGTEGDEESYVNEIMISTVCGNDKAFKSSTIRNAADDGAIIGQDQNDWKHYEAASQYKISLPSAGVWTIYIAPDDGQILFMQIEGVVREPVDIVTNPEVLVIEGKERDDLSDTFENEERTGREEEGGAGETWDNQFFIVANRVLKGGEQTVIEFDYVATASFACPTGTHGQPGEYKKNAFGDVNFTTTEDHFKADYEIPSTGWGGEALSGMQSISFDLAVLKEANTYTIKNVRWYLKDATLNEEDKTLENLINETGTENFRVKVGAGNDVLPYAEYVTGIFSVINDATTRTDVIYNLSGQRVSKDYKGVVIMNGRKVVNK